MRGTGLLCVLALVGVSLAEDSAPIAETPLGKVSGYLRTSRGGKTFAAFKKVPYGKPPVGQLRFKAPEPIGKWEGTYNASQSFPVCAQYLPFGNGSSVGVEDCLYLSVYTHNVLGNYPVLVHFHGGAFAIGNADDKQPNYLMDEDIVIVRTNYRVGILGFLSLENDVAPGNQGMKDQVEALRWVQRNIASFGGDPTKVTIIGESAGGASVYHHLISPLTKGLFHGAISESGTSYGLWTVAPPGFARSKAEQVLKFLNCSTTDFKKGIQCARRVPAAEVVSQFRHILIWQTDVLPTFGPVLEKQGPDAFLVGPISKWEHKPVPLLMGITSAEGLLKTAGYAATGGLDWKVFTKDFNKIAPITFGYFATASNPDEVTTQIRKFYLPNENITINDFVNLTMIYTDSLFTIAALDGANNHKGDVYFYYFDYILKELTPTLDEKFIFGATHVAESYFIWQKFDKTKKELITRKADIDLSINLVRIVGNFVKDGTPIPQRMLLIWNKWTPTKNNYIHVEKSGIFTPRQGLAVERYKFWKSLNYRDNYEKDGSGNYSSGKHISYPLIILIIIMLLYKLI